MKEEKSGSINNQEEIKLKRFSTPYSFLEKLSWLKNNLIGPSNKFKELTKFIPQDFELNSISPQLKIGFVGDMMPIGKKELIICKKLKKFISDIGFLVGNFEGTISHNKKVFMSQAHSEKILNLLEDIFPPKKTVLSFANNHSGDFGKDEFEKSYNKFKEYGFLTIGKKGEASILLNNSINIMAVTKWSNQKCLFIEYLNEAELCLNKNAKFNILFPHWGYELQLYPNPDQIELTKNLLKKWDMIIGHHSHCPQPVTNYDNKLVAYSLGDFFIGKKLKKYLYGIILKTELGPNKKNLWQTGKVEWKFVSIEFLDGNKIELDIEDNCKFFT